MTKILYVSPQEFPDIFAQQIAQRSSALIIMEQNCSDNELEHKICELLAKEYKWLKINCAGNPRKIFYQEIAGKLDLPITDTNGKSLLLKELKDVISNNIHESNILLFPEGAKLFNLSSTGDWLSGLIEKGAIVITYRSKALEEGVRLQLIGIKLKDRPETDVNIPSSQNSDVMNSRELRPLLPLNGINSRLQQAFVPRSLPVSIHKIYAKPNRYRGILLGFFTLGLSISFLPILGLSIHNTVLYIIAGFALIGFVIVK
ncbi:MAG: hypothetical protein N5P05_000386 [Chroococcopsis gigantea SAG 12.99]|jgi:hypothetical protein|nr:hypothetical protein [Chroococcopsis gigantea SAG 12.99]